MIIARSRLYAFSLCLLATACSSDDDAPEKGDGSAEPWSAGDYPADRAAQSYLTIEGVAGQNGAVRGYKVHVPPSYDSSKPTPVVFALHGLGQNAVMFAVQAAGWPEKADKEGFILVMPTGTLQNADGTWGATGSWNAGECCGPSAQSELDDVALIRAIAKEVGSHLNVDDKRVYATGLSNGGFLSFRLACEAADLFTAIAPGAGAIGMTSIAPMGIGNSNFSACKPSRPVSVLSMHGTSDPLVSYSFVKPSLDLIAQANGCGTTTKPASTPASAGDTTCITYEGCPAGIEVTGCSVEGGGHCWFGSETCGTGASFGNIIVGANSNSLVNTDAAWQFLSRFSR